MSRGRIIAVSSLSAALAVIFAVASGYIQSLTITLGVMSSAAISIPLIYDNKKSAILSYIAASILVAIFIPYQAVLFVLFFGIYPLIFFYSERIKNIYLKYLLKSVFFGAVLTAFYFLSGLILSVEIISKIRENFLFSLFLLIGIILLLFYDYLWKRVFFILKSKFKNIIK